MVKENTGTSENLVGFTIIGDLPKSGRFCDGIGASGLFSAGICRFRMLAPAWSSQKFFE